MESPQAFECGSLQGSSQCSRERLGVTVTWTYYDPPYIESGEELYDDMVLAYQSRAKYIVVFNYPKVSMNPYGILEEEHFDAMKKFWNYINCYPRTIYRMNERVAYVLPKDYGYGFRGPDDKIWGLWEADSLSNKTWNDVNNLLEYYGLKLDIIYDDARFNFEEKYPKIYFWNSTTN